MKSITENLKQFKKNPKDVKFSELCKVCDFYFGDIRQSGSPCVRNIVAEVIQDMRGNNEKVPEPIAVKNYSGKFMVQVPPEIHRALALKAAEAGVSLNRLASSKLSL